MAYLKKTLLNMQFGLVTGDESEKVAGMKSSPGEE